MVKVAEIVVAAATEFESVMVMFWLVTTQVEEMLHEQLPETGDPRGAMMVTKLPMVKALVVVNCKV